MLIFILEFFRSLNKADKNEMIITIALCFVQLCIALEMPDEMREAMKNEVQEKLYEGTPNVLLTLGDTIKDSLQHPTEDRNHGRQTLRGLHEYYNNLNDVYLAMKASGDVEKKLGLKLFRMLVEGGGPPHINIEFDIEDAMKKFEWNNKAVYSVREIIDDTEALWEKMQIQAEKLNTVKQ